MRKVGGIVIVRWQQRLHDGKHQFPKRAGGFCGWIWCDYDVHWGEVGMTCALVRLYEVLRLEGGSGRMIRHRGSNAVNHVGWRALEECEHTTGFGKLETMLFCS